MAGQLMTVKEMRRIYRKAKMMDIRHQYNPQPAA
jgi:hypothetical protein